MMKKSDIQQPPCYFDKYINFIEDIEISEAFNQSQTELDNLDLAKFNQIGNSVYAEGKWTIKDIIQHLIDAERVLAYRTLRIGRNDKTPLSGFDEALFAANIDTTDRNLESIIAELKIVRESTSLLFATFSGEALQRFSKIADNQMSVLAYGFAIIGHQKYHLKIIEDKYYPLVNSESKGVSNENG